MSDKEQSEGNYSLLRCKFIEMNSTTRCKTVAISPSQREKRGVEGGSLPSPPSPFTVRRLLSFPARFHFYANPCASFSSFCLRLATEKEFFELIFSPAPSDIPRAGIYIFVGPLASASPIPKLRLDSTPVGSHCVFQFLSLSLSLSLSLAFSLLALSRQRSRSRNAKRGRGQFHAVNCRRGTHFVVAACAGDSNN